MIKKSEWNYSESFKVYTRKHLEGVGIVTQQNQSDYRTVQQGQT